MTIEEARKGVDLDKSESQTGGYELATITIKKAKYLTDKESGIDLERYSWAKGGISLKLTLWIVSPSHPEGKLHEERPQVITNAKGEFKTNIRFTDKDGHPVAASYIYDITHACKEFSQEQREAMKGVQNLEDSLPGKQFNMNVKYVIGKDGGEYVYLETDKQKIADEQYQKSKQPEVKSDIDF